MLTDALPALRRYVCAGLLTGFIYTTALWGQSASLGVKAGVPVTDYFDTGSTGIAFGTARYSTAQRRYTFGLSGELRTEKGLGLEIDALYHRMGYNAAFASFNPATGISTNTNIIVKGNSWDFPVMLKYRVGHRIQPYVAAGGVLRWIASARETGEVLASAPGAGTSNLALGTNDVSDLAKSLYLGVTVGGGVEVPAGNLRLLPEFRYTRWTSNIAGEGGLLRFNPNQVEFLLGVSF
jgi:hypothetical protein